MSNESPSSNRRWQEVLKVALGLPLMILTLPFVLLGLVIIVVIVIPQMLCCGAVTWTRLKRAGRISSRHKIIAAGHPGTLIVNRPAAGWNATECWWTRDRILSITPHSIPTDEDRSAQLKESRKIDQFVAPPFDHWCWENYLHPQTGKAQLISSSKGDRMAERLKAKLSNVDVVRTESCTVWLDQRCRAQSVQTKTLETPRES